MKNKVFKVILILALVFSLNAMNLIILGNGIVIAIGESYENQSIKTNVENIEFDAYVNSEKSKTYEKQAIIQNGETLILNIKVKNKGVLSNAKIQIESKNIRIKKDEVNNSYVKNIDINSNIMELNDVVYGNDINIEIPVEFIKQNSFEQDYFSTVNNINLSGIYKDDREQEVNATKTIKLNWTEDIDVELNQSIEKYICLEGEKTLLQQSVITKIQDNKLPKGNEQVEVDVPKIQSKSIEEIYVIFNGRRLEQDKVNYNRETGKLIIDNKKVVNKDNTVDWGETENKYKIVYIYAKEQIRQEESSADNITESQNTISPIEIQLHIKTITDVYGKGVFEKENTQTIEIEPKGNIVSTKTNIENELYKGYLYAGVENETIYTQKNVVEISKADLVENIQLQTVKVEFANDINNRFINNNVIYKSTKLNKAEFDTILGENGQILIKDGNDKIISTVDKNTKTDENNNIIINYENELNNIKIVSTKPIVEGNITIENIKAIKGNTGYTRERLENFSKLVDTVKISSNLGEEIGEAGTVLKDTKTQAKIEMSNTNLSTLQNNENIQLLVTLLSNSGEYDLYKNPTVEIILPKELSVDVKKITQLNAKEGLTIVDPKLYTNSNGEKVIKMTLKGEQKIFENDINEGIQISITLDILIEKTVASKEDKIIMNYTNENKEGDTFQTDVGIKLNSKYGVLMVNEVSNFNNSSDVIESLDDRLKIGELDANSEEKAVKGNVAIVNNYDEEIKNVSIIGTVPEVSKEDTAVDTVKATFESNLLNSINVDGKNAKVYYSEESNASKNSDTWTQDIKNISKQKSFKVELMDNIIAPKENVKISYDFLIPADLEAKQSTYSSISLNYTYGENEVNTNSTILLQTPKASIQEPVIEDKTGDLSISLIAKSGGEALNEGDIVYEGQGIKYIVAVTNNTDKDINNVKLTATQDNAIFYVEKEYNDGWDSGTNAKDIKYTMIEEDSSVTEYTMNIDNLKAGETKTYDYQFSVKEVEGEDKQTFGAIRITADDMQEKTVKTLTNKIKQAKLKVQMKKKYEEEYTVTSNVKYPFFYEITNISDEKQENAILEMEIPEGLEFNTDYLFVSDKYEFVECQNNILKLKIPNIDVDEKISIRLSLFVQKMDYDVELKEFDLYCKVLLDSETYYSNEINQIIKNVEVEIVAKQEGSIKENEVSNGDNLTYKFTIENKGTLDKKISIMDNVPQGAEINKAYIEIYDSIDGSLKETKELEIGEYNYVSFIETLRAKQKIIMYIGTTINAEKIYTSEIINKIDISVPMQIVTCNSVIYKVTGKGVIDPDDKETYSIKGTAWVDKNKNGLKEATEDKLPNIEVLLINEKTGEIAKDKNNNEARKYTGSNGDYEFSNIEKGEYTVVFKYNATKYRVTEYQKEGIEENTNSDVITKVINLNGKEEQVAITGTLKVDNKNLTNIDAGFVEGEIFDLRLEKTVTRVTIKNSTGTRVQSYDKTQLAKIELDAKVVNNTQVNILYQIKITNEGDVSGYVNEIVDYIPSDLTFDTTLNKDWYIGSDKQLYTKQLSNQIINPGETKTVTLELNKSMNENNTGTTINIAEINKATNDLLLQDIDSIPANKVNGEDDMSKAEVIISIRTGATIWYISLAFMIIVVIGVGVYLINKKVLKSK